PLDLRGAEYLARQPGRESCQLVEIEQPQAERPDLRLNAGHQLRVARDDRGAHFSASSITRSHILGKDMPSFGRSWKIAIQATPATNIPTSYSRMASIAALALP